MPDLDPTPGTLAHLIPYLRQLPSGGAGAFLIVNVGESQDDFIQVSWSEDGFCVDHPVITPAQKERAEAVKRACAEVGYEVDELSDHDQVEFLDCYVPNDVDQAAVVAAGILRSAFGVADDTALSYNGSGVGPLRANSGL